MSETPENAGTERIPLLSKTSTPPSVPEHEPLHGQTDNTMATSPIQNAPGNDVAPLSLEPSLSKPESGRTPISSRASSRASSPTASDASDELPNNVSSEEQLRLLPDECLSGEKERPLRHIDEDDEEYHYALRPMFYSVVFILSVELLERFSFYGVNYTQTSFLTGAYDEDWNAGMEAVSASTYVSVSVAVAYTTPFLGAFLADSLLGDYWALFVGSLVFYLPGLFLIFLTTIPGLLGKEFNQGALATGLLFLWPAGTGIVKSVVNVFGAKQFHPLLQSSLIEAYYVKFYMCINIGALVGGVAVPLLAQRNVTLAYFLPVAMLTAGVSLFAAGSSRYVRHKAKGSFLSKKEKKKQPSYAPPVDTIPLTVVLRISLLIIPFCIAYSQMATTFIVQGTVMEKAFGWIDAACMNNADAIAVLFFGHVIGSSFYPMLARRGIKIPTAHKFAIGSGLGAAAIAWALLVELMIHKEYEKTGGKVNIMWQAMSYILIGAGEIFAVSAAYEVAFTASPPEKKVLASAVNLFCIGGLPNVICIFLYHACRRWFENKWGTTMITHIADYSTAHVDYYFFLLFVIAMLGVVINMLPDVREFVESIEDRATEMIKTPKTPKRPPRRERAELEMDDEETALLRARRHQAYLKYGSGPVLYKSGSMRAGQSMSQRNLKPQKHVKRTLISKLYRSDPVLPGVGTVINSQGQPVPTGQFLPPKKQMVREESPLERSSSTGGPTLMRSTSS